MPYCYYTCKLLPLGLVGRNGFTPQWLGNHLLHADAPARREALSIHPMTCPRHQLVAAADALFAGAPGESAGADDAPDGGFASAGTENDEGVSSHDCLVVPGGCDAARRMGDLLAATYPDRVFVLPMPRSSGPEVVKTLAGELRRLEDWLGARRPEGAARPAEPVAAGDIASRARPAEAAGRRPSVEYPAAPGPGGVFVVAGPLTDDSLLRLIGQLGAHVSGLESCTSPDRCEPLADEGSADGSGTDSDYSALAAKLLEIGMCPRRSTVERRDYLARRLDEARASSVIYARQSFCDPGAYDALLVAQLAKERGLPYLEIEVDFPFDANGPLRTRVEAFLEAQLLDEDLLGDFDFLLDDMGDDDLHSGAAGPSAGAADFDEED